MDFIRQIISDATLYALGWTVIHSLWQAMVVALLLGVLNLGLQGRSARLRYLAANGALFLVLILSIVTFLDYRQLAAGPELVAAAETATVGTATLMGPAPAAGPAGLPGFFQQFTDYFNANLPLIVTIWLLGVALFALRLLGGLAYVQHLKHDGTYAMPAYWEERLRQLCLAMNVRPPVRLLESARVGVPMVVGYLKPVILLPVGAVNALDTDQVEAILAHELAHIVRRDYLFNIFQSMVEVLYYFNPAVWWISANIRTERENCCDDIAIGICGSSLVYAKALVSLQELSRRGPALAMTFSRGRNQLLNRVRRILDQPSHKANVLEKLAATLIVLVAIVFLSAGQVESDLMAATADAEVPALEMVEVRALSPETSALHEPVREIVRLVIDTLPNEKTRLNVVRGNGEEIEVKIENRRIQYLNIDGREIPEAEYHQYEGMVEGLLAEADAIPMPPVPPVPPVPGAAPIPPAPPAPGAPSAPPAPPAPPSAPQPPAKWYFKENQQLKTKKLKNGDTQIIIESENGEPLSLEFREGGKGNVIILNGETLWDGSADFFGEALAAGIQLPSWVGIDSMNFLELSDLENMDLPSFSAEEMRDLLEEQRLQLHQNLGEYRDLLGEARQWAWTLPGREGFFFFHPDTGEPGNYTRVEGEAILNNGIRLALEAELVKDKLIDDPGEYRLELSDREMRLNGQRLTETTAKKYRRIYQRNAGKKLGEDGRIVIERR